LIPVTAFDKEPRVQHPRRSRNAAKGKRRAERRYDKALTLLHDLNPEREAGSVEVLLLAVGENVFEGSALLERKGGLDLVDLCEDELVVVLDVGESGEDELSLLDATLFDEPSRRLREL
jgi:hypothetical protein